MASLESISIMVGEQITVEQLIEKRIIMTIFKEMIMYIGIMSETSRPTPACTYYYMLRLELALVFLEEKRVMEQ